MSSFSDDDLAEMVSRLAHKVRNPLATIKTSVQLVEHLAHPQGEIAEYLGSVSHEVDRIDQTLREMQVFVRLSPGALSSFSVPPFVEEVVHSYGRQSEGRHFEVRDGSDIELVADRDLLATALLEILRNAHRHTPSEQIVTIGWEVFDGSLHFHIDDCGPGIADHIAERILRPFYSTSTDGSGLGLNIAAKALALMGGRLRWENLVAGGCRFSLVLPCTLADGTNGKSEQWLSA